jgi:molybdopterin molybdotransferase
VSGAASPELISFHEARERVLAAAVPLASESVPLLEARGRALARAFSSPIALPPFANSSMDGYAVRAADLAAAAPAAALELPVVAVIAAGHVASRALASGQAMRIMTGAMVPEGADAVVPFEECERLENTDGERVRFTNAPRSGDNVRSAGRDVREGDVLLDAGRELSAHDLALLGAVGCTSVEVVRRARVAILSTGDELVELGAPLVPGAIRDTNRPLLAMLLEECGAYVVAAEKVNDDPAAFTAAARRLLGGSDLLLSIGGVSAGDFDPVKVGLAELGGIALWRVAMKPGRPQAFGRPLGRVFFGLPGNPASVACVFEVLVRPALRRMQGFTSIERPRIEARAAEVFGSREGRTDFIRVTLEWKGGEWWARSAGDQVSGHLAPQSRAHALLEIPEGASALEIGENARAIVLRWP